MNKDLIQLFQDEDISKYDSLWSKESHPFLTEPAYSTPSKRKITSFGLLRSQGKRTCYVQDVFLRLISYLPEEDKQKLLYLELYMEIYKRMDGHSFKKWQNNQSLNHKKFSPYFVSSERESQSHYSHLGMRQLMASQKSGIYLHKKDDFQIACALNYFFEEAMQISEQQNEANLLKIAEEAFSLSKVLPDSLNPNQQEKTMIHISSLKEISKKRAKKLTPLENKQVQKFFTALLDFGFAFCSSKTW